METKKTSKKTVKKTQAAKSLEKIAAKPKIKAVNLDAPEEKIQAPKPAPKAEAVKLTVTENQEPVMAAAIGSDTVPDDVSFFDSIAVNNGPEFDIAGMGYNGAPQTPTNGQGWEEVAPNRYQNPAFVTPEQFHSGYYQLHNLLGNVSGLETVKILPNEEQDFREVAHEVYWSLVDMPMMHFALDKEAAWLSGTMKACFVVFSFYAGKARLVKSEIEIIRAEKRKLIDDARNRKSGSYDSVGDKTPDSEPVKSTSHEDDPHTLGNGRQATQEEMDIAAQLQSGGMFI